MPTFTYRARDKAGVLVAGELEAINLSDVRETLAREKLIPVSIETKGIEFSLSTLFQRAPGPKELANMTRLFQVMFSVGTPVDRILETLSRQTKNPKMQSAIKSIKSDVAGGTRLSVAFGRHPEYFSPLYLSMMEVGEAGGVLDKTLKEMASILEKESEIHSKIKSAMLYPKIVMFILLAVTWGMLAFVIPPFKSFYGKNGAQLPLPTRIVMAFSDIVTTYWYVPLIVGVIAMLAWREFKKTPTGIRFVSAAAFRLPVFGRLNLLTANARFGHLIASLYRSGVPISYALGVIANTMSNFLYAEELRGLKKGLEQGRSLSKCMESTLYFEPMVQQACAVGEQSGKLDDLLEATAIFYDTEIDDMLKNMSTLIEPFLLVFLFGLVLLLALAVYMPIWGLSKVVLPN